MATEQNRFEIRMANGLWEGLWEAWNDIYDVMDLRHLFNEEDEIVEEEELDEIAEIYRENPLYYRFLLYQQEDIDFEVDSGYGSDSDYEQEYYDDDPWE